MLSLLPVQLLREPVSRIPDDFLGTIVLQANLQDYWDLVHPEEIVSKLRWRPRHTSETIGSFLFQLKFEINVAIPAIYQCICFHRRKHSDETFSKQISL